MLDTILGLPLHPLIVHATVVVVPAAALAVLLAAVWPRFRRWARWGTPALAVAAVILTPLSTSSGESLEERVGASKLVHEHAELADMLLPWVLALAVGALGVWWLHRGGRARHGGRWLPLTLAAVSVIAALGTTVQVVLIGHSGAKAAWQPRMAASAGSTSQGGGDGD